MNKPILNTNNTGTQVPLATETIQGTISLHKVSKTGNYNDLLNKPTLDFIPNSEKGVANGVAQLDNNSKLSSDNLPVATTTTLGAIKVGKNLAIDDDGTLSAVSGGSGGVVNEILIGGVIEYPSNKTIPDGWLECDGSAVSRTTYSELFAVIGTEFGSGDGSTTFNLPNMKGRVAVGLDTSDSDFNTIGKTGGEKTHTLTELEMPKHWHKTAIDFGGDESLDNYSGYGYNSTSRYYNNTTTAGGDQPHNNLQPYFVTKFIIKAKESSAVIATVIDNLTSTSSTDALSANQGRLLNEKFNNYLPLAGGDMTGDINFNYNGLYWKEPGFGDQFKIVPQFGGSGDENYLAIQGATGDAGTQPDVYDLVRILGQTGRLFLKPEGGIDLGGNATSRHDPDGDCLITLDNDGASNTESNITFRSWYGVGFSPTISNMTIPRGENAAFINCRTGDFTARGQITGNTLKVNTMERNKTDTWVPVISNGVFNYTRRRLPNDRTNTGWGNGEEDDLATMRFLSFWDGAYSGGNSNLVYCARGTIKPYPTVLYNNDGGTTGSITLSANASNYSYFEIYFRDQEYQFSGSIIYAPNGKRVNLGMTVSNSSVNGAWAKMKAITINGTNVNVDWSGEADIINHAMYQYNNLFITRIVGYPN